MMTEEQAKKHIVFYDGECGFCNYWVQWILKQDAKNDFLFSALQSNHGQEFLKERGLSTDIFDTIILWKPGEYYYKKSEAILRIAKIIGGKYGLFASLNPFPKFLADKIYDQIAANRQKILNQSCLIPTKEELEKFI